MEIEKISNGQLFTFIFLFEMGTAIVVPAGLVSQKTVWLSIILASLGGMLLYLLYHYLSLEYPDLVLSGYAQKILGKYIGGFVSFIYIIFFIYLCSRDLRETSSLLISSVYSETPLLVIASLLIIVVIYALNKGIEVLARTAELYFFVIIFFGFFFSLFIILSGIIKVENLLPLLEEGWKPVIKNAYPNIFMFPFGEMICFATIFPNLNNLKSGRKTGISALTLSTIVLAFTHALEISVLGETRYGQTPFPLLLTIQKVEIGNFIQRLDIIAVLALIICVFFKISIYCIAIVIMVSDLFKVKNKKKLVLPIGFLILLSSIIIASNLSEHIKEGELAIRILLPLIAVVFPLLLFVVHLVRKKFGGHLSKNEL
ncbi:GerAB/ArcD/ProY family transporter [Bacillus sp. ISL-75]|uniref:GerAB/ArcD/ProY family transporter n=1 Tax=Bacillus sp. ISL-75 TaxID=2819137 RepID=UPI001BE54974|nr:GerAB/ArcD/ProY family transporter [Bacillus sp. ISL-75]MBT2729448.1 GerAB/ArcD/ProY family transporter [Bacillus sp. ISL-75]